MFFLAEYSNMLLISSLNIFFFWGGWLFPIFDYNLYFELILSIKIAIFCYLFIWVRSTFPRYRFDQLMDICWKKFLPLIIGYLLFICGFFFFFDILYFNGNIYINQTDLIYLI
jgi:NADH-quinone oxidoreductase subunit H